MNVILNSKNKYIEIQGTAEQNPFSQTELLELLNLAQNGATIVMQEQNKIISPTK